MKKPTYVVAILGVSPAILTELLWWLIAQDERNILGIEVWTTASAINPWTGARKLQEAIDDGLWKALREALGEDAECLPPLPVLAMTQPPPGVRELTSMARRWSLVAFSRGKRVLDDIRTSDDAEAVYAALHDRIRTLRQTLPEGVQLVGSLAGGRKTMSAALQAAFSLQARPQDRLLHVLVDHRIESDRERMKMFRVPDPALDIPLSEQVTVSEVRFPPLRFLLQSTRLRDDLDRLSYAELWGALGAALRAEGEQHATLVELAPGSWSLTIYSGQQPLHTIPLTQGQAETYIALLQPGGPHTDEAWYRWLLANPQGQAPSERLSPWETDTEFPGREVAKNRFSNLKRHLEALVRRGVGDFSAQSKGKRSPTRWVLGVDRVIVKRLEN